MLGLHILHFTCWISFWDMKNVVQSFWQDCRRKTSVFIRRMGSCNRGTRMMVRGDPRHEEKDGMPQKEEDAKAWGSRGGESTNGTHSIHGSGCSSSMIREHLKRKETAQDSCLAVYSWPASCSALAQCCRKIQEWCWYSPPRSPLRIPSLLLNVTVKKDGSQMHNYYFGARICFLFHLWL